MIDLERRFVDCFVAAMDDACLPDDAPIRGYPEWAAAGVLAHSPVDAVEADGLPVPRSRWDGRTALTPPAARPGREPQAPQGR